MTKQEEAELEILYIRKQWYAITEAELARLKYLEDKKKCYK
jgi:hypothetical protein